MSESFFSRWSRQKRAVTESPATPPQQAADAVPSTAPAVDLPKPATGQPPVEAPLPTLEDAQALTPGSDFQPFMQRGVGTEVRNAAMKKLFADPHFNVMDGLDIYIDDYNRPDPMPAGMLRQMASAQFLGLVPPEAPTDPLQAGQDPAALTAAVQGPQVVAQSPDSSVKAEPHSHDHTDLQLQPDPAPADPTSGPGPQ